MSSASLNLGLPPATSSICPSAPGAMVCSTGTEEESLDQARRNAYNDVSDRTAQVLLKGAAEIQRTRWVERGAEPEQEQTEMYISRSNASVARDVSGQGAFRAVERERQKAEARGKIAKMKEGEKAGAPGASVPARLSSIPGRGI